MVCRSKQEHNNKKSLSCQSKLTMPCRGPAFSQRSGPDFSHHSGKNCSRCFEDSFPKKKLFMPLDILVAVKFSAGHFAYSEQPISWKQVAWDLQQVLTPGMGGFTLPSQGVDFWPGPKNRDVRFSVTRQTALPIRIVLRFCVGGCGRFEKLAYGCRNP